MAVGGSRVVALPPDWLAALGLDLGDAVDVIYDSIVLVKPQSMRLDLEFLVKELALLSPTGRMSRRGAPL